MLVVPYTLVSDADAAGDDYYSYTIHPDGTIEGGYSPIGTSATEGSYTSVGNTNSGSWTWSGGGYGPFNSFYAAFDPAQDNLMIGHLDPDDLTRLVDGTSIAGQDYNVMWCLPTVYWMTDSSGNLVLTNDPDSGGIAYAHTIDGHVYSYIGIGVYEASTLSVGGQTILTSISGDTPLVSQTRATFRDYANNQSVDTEGSGANGHAMVWNFYQWQLYRFCTLAVMGGWDSQGIAGNGDVYGDGAPYYTIPGQLDQSGPYAGTKGSINSTYGTDSVKVFIENVWGSVFDFVDGIVINGRSGYYIQSSVPTDATSGQYVTYIAQSLPSSGWGSDPCTSHPELWGMPTANGGSSTSGLYDYISTSTSSNRVLCVGGYSHDTSPAGLSYAYARSSLTYASPTLGGRLAFVFDADPASTQGESTVSFVDADNPMTEYYKQTVETGGVAARPENPAKQGFVFDGWYTSDGVLWDFDDPVQQDMTLYARWIVELKFLSVPTSAQIVWARA